MLLAIVTFLLALAFAAGPVLFPEFNGYPADSFPIPQRNAPVQPAGYAFAIWGPIYLWLLVSAGFGLWQRPANGGWARTRPPLLLSLAVGTVWLPLAQRAPVLATAALWLMWAGALSALFRAPSTDKAFLVWPLGLYAGWLSAAACVGTGLVIAGYGLVDQRGAALAMLALAIALGAAIQFRLGHAPTFGLAIVWALAGIVVANASARVDIAGLALGGAFGIAALTIFRAVQSGRAGRVR
jgi:hypothetical protein